MKKTFAVSVLCAVALVIGCSSTQQAEVSPGAVDGSKASGQAPLACSPTSCKVTSCPSAKPSCSTATKETEETASPGAVGAKKSCCPSAKTKGAAAKQCPSMKSKEAAPEQDTTVSPGAFSDDGCCPPCPKCPKCPAHPNGCPPCPPCPPGCC